MLYQCLYLWLSVCLGFGFFVFNFSCSVMLYSVFVVGIVLGWVVGLGFESFLYLISVVGLCFIWCLCGICGWVSVGCSAGYGILFYLILVVGLCFIWCLSWELLGWC